FLFILTGMSLFIIYHVTTLTSMAAWISGPIRSPAGWSHAHLLLLGWGTMIAMGAVYQLINVVLQTKLYSEKLGFIQYAFSVIGVIGLALSFNMTNWAW